MLELSREKKGGGSSLTKDMEKVLSSLANEDALKIFHEAKDGITNSTETIEKLGLTQKRYYARLKPLIEAGVMQKTEKGYNLTFLGKIIYEILYRKLGRTLESRDRIALIDRLNKAESLSKEEKEQISAAISVKDKIIGYSDLFGGIKPVEIVWSYDEVMDVIASLIGKANSRILLASRYMDSRAFEPIIQACKRGVEMYVLDGDESNFLAKMQLLRLIFSSPKQVKQIIDILGSSDKLKIRYANLRYSFAVIDGENCALEIVDPASNKFLFGLIINNKEISSRFMHAFNDLYEKSELDPFVKLLSDKLKNR